MERIGVGLIGTGFMGKCHAMAYGAVRAVFGDVPLIERVALCDVEAGHAARVGGGLRLRPLDHGLARPPRGPCDRPRLGHLAERAAPRDGGGGAGGGQARLVREADGADARRTPRRWRTAAARSGRATALGYGYLQNPALQEARRLIAAGAIGVPFDFRGSVDEDYMADPALPWSWRLRAEDAGLGTLGDLTVHLVSLARALMGEIESLTAMVDDGACRAAGAGRAARRGWRTRTSPTPSCGSRAARGGRWRRAGSRTGGRTG